MVVKCATLYVGTAHADAFIAATKINQACSRQESGVIAFDFFHHQSNPEQYLLYEVYNTQEAVVAHTETDHYKTWISTVRDWFVKPVDRALYDVID